MSDFITQEEKNEIGMEIRNKIPEPAQTNYQRWFEGRKPLYPKGQIRFEAVERQPYAVYELDTLRLDAIAYIYFDNDWETAKEILKLGFQSLRRHERRYEYNRFDQCLCLEAENFAYHLETLGFSDLAQCVCSSGVYCRANPNSIMLSVHKVQKCTKPEVLKTFHSYIQSLTRAYSES